jgi:sugar transferase (PEP-CTERM/EpsH1 system associated)
MNILWLSHLVPYPPKGGNLQRSYNLLRALAEKNHVFFLAFNQKFLLPTPEMVRTSVEKLKGHCDYVRVFDIPCEKRRLAWFWLLFLNLFSAHPYSVKKFLSPRMMEAVKGVVHNHKIDLVHFDTIALVQYSAYIEDSKKVLNHHNVESMLLFRMAQAEKNLLKKLYLCFQGKKLKRYEAETIKWFDLNLVVSQPDKEEIQSYSWDANVEIIPNGVDPEYFHISETPIRKSNLVFTGGMNWFPNRDAIIFFLEEIWPLVKKVIPDLSLTLIGHQPPEEAISLSKKEKIEVLGFIDDVRPYVAQATAYIVPIRVGGGTRLKILDAWACGKAVVSTSIGCEGLEVTPGRNILIGDTPGQFAEQVIKVCADGNLRRSLGKEGRKLVEEKYSWKMIGEDLNRIYENLISKKHQGTDSTKKSVINQVRNFMKGPTDGNK